jgi:5-methylcytosine-specific restriction endonuclease McrA
MMTENVACTKCGCEERKEELTPNLVHYGKLVCAGCGKMLTWIPKPDVEKSRRPANHNSLVKKYSRGFCELCLRGLEELPARQTLEGHHVLEYDDGGDSTRENVQILCTACHKHVHHVRTWFFPNSVNEEERERAIRGREEKRNCELKEREEEKEKRRKLKQWEADAEMREAIGPPLNDAEFEAQMRDYDAALVRRGRKPTGYFVSEAGIEEDCPFDTGLAPQDK